MKVIIAGGRDVYLPRILEMAIAVSGFEITEVVCGKARGMDTCGDDWAYANKVPVKYFPANWEMHGKAAGHIRNLQMAMYADALILIWDGKSKGSANMLQNAKTEGLKIFSVIV